MIKLVFNFKKPKETNWILEDENAIDFRKDIVEEPLVKSMDYCCVCCHFRPIEDNDEEGYCLAPVPQWCGSNNKRTVVKALQEARLCDCYVNIETLDHARIRRYLKLEDANV